MEEFRIKIINFAKNAVIIKDECKNEEQTKMSLIVPFLEEILGYDCQNPTDVSPEYECSQYVQRGKVDYAILINNKPTIAIECKHICNNLDNCTEQLKFYFNLSNFKIGITTNGLIWKFFTDLKDPNKMDEQPFLTLNLENITRSNIYDTDLECLMSLQKKNFELKNIKNTGNKSRIFNIFLQEIINLSKEPNDQFCKLFLDKADLKFVKQKSREEYKKMLKKAFQTFINQEIMHYNQKTEINQNEIKNCNKWQTILSSNEKGDLTKKEFEYCELISQILLQFVKDKKLKEEALNNIHSKVCKYVINVFYKTEKKEKIFAITRDPTHKKPSEIRFANNNNIIIKNSSDFNSISDIILKAIYEKLK